MANVTDDRPPIDAFVHIAELASALGVTPITQFEGCWTHAIDEQWWIAANGHPEPRQADAAGAPGSGGMSHLFEVPPMHAVVYFNGWPAGLLNPFGGTLAAGAAANEDEFIAALRQAISNLQGNRSNRG